MNTQLDRAISLLFPQQGRQALDVKFFFQGDATEEALAEQILVCMASLDDDSLTITNVDQGLTLLAA
ncbi:hypothetical protein [Sphingomonas beigongshangi]|uniref:hypothetical protein n=1 Tax=Sphingomonas beigongshangi TaxID=2782540 RepID=UPI00193B6563|nr:hypothetical protein [Sphingomonas beigongshangi]